MDGVMCTDMKCPVKFKCYRHTAPWNQFRQTVYSESPRQRYTCNEFWDNKGRTLDPKFREYENFEDEK